MHRVLIHAVFETGTTQTDCDEARKTVEQMFQSEMAALQLFGVRVEKIEVEPLTDSSARCLTHACFTRGVDVD